MLTLNPHGEYEKGMVEKIAQTLFDSIDKKDANKGIKQKEFENWCQLHPDCGIPSESVEDIFMQYDTDGDKRISREEFLYLVKQRNMQSQNFEKGPIKARLDQITNKIYRAVDVDDSGSIEFQEFNEWLMADASLGTVQNLCDVMKDMTNDLKHFNKNASCALETIVTVAGRGTSEEDERKKKEEEKKLQKDLEKKAKKKIKKDKKQAEKDQKVYNDLKDKKDIEQKIKDKAAIKLKPSYKVAAAANPYAREHSEAGSPRG